MLEVGGILFPDRFTEIDGRLRQEKRMQEMGVSVDPSLGAREERRMLI
jgi:hypothetical protein